MRIPTHRPRKARAAATGAALCLASHALCAGDFSAALNDPANDHDSPIPGFTGPHGTGKARLFEGFDLESNEPLYQNPDNYVHPVFFGWAAAVANYSPSELSFAFGSPSLALGPVTGEVFDVVALGDMSSTAITGGSSPGSITLIMPKPVRNLNGADFVVFENGSITLFDQGGAGVGGIFAELAYVEVSADGANFVRFPSQSKTTSAVGPYGSIHAGDVFNLAGKHSNAYGESWGTPFDLTDIGLVAITHIRLVDIPGNGSFRDSQSRPIYDAWKTHESGGFDLEAVGAISMDMIYQEWPGLEPLPAGLRGANDDPDGDGVPNLLEYAFARLPWKADTTEGLPVLTTTPQPDGSVTCELVFTRDERLVDLAYEVQVSSNLAPDGWTTIARGDSGSPLVATPGHAPLISEESASEIASLGVLRRVTVRDAAATTAGRKLYRVKISTINAP